MYEELFIVDDDMNLTIIVMRIFLDPEVAKQAIDDLGKSMSAISLPTSKLTLEKLNESFLRSKSSDYLNLSITIIHTLL